MAILEALRMFLRSFQGRLIVESDSYNASWVSSDKGKPWKLHFSFNEIKYLSSFISIEFHHVSQSVNRLADTLAKQGIDRITPWEVYL